MSITFNGEWATTVTTRGKSDGSSKERRLDWTHLQQKQSSPPAYNNLGVTKSHSGCHDYRAGMFCVWCALSPKKELSITLFSVKHELTSIAVDYYRLLALFSINIDQYRLLYVYQLLPSITECGNSGMWIIWRSVTWLTVTRVSRTAHGVRTSVCKRVTVPLFSRY
jgi:hypothetical protein